MRLAITGAGGFVGRALLRAASAAGHETVALTRATAPVAGAGTTVTCAGLTDRDALRRAFAGADAIVHLAARVHVMQAEGRDGDARFHEANVEGTRAVVEAATASGARRLLFVSTAKVHGEGQAVPYRGSDALRPVGGYARSKAEAEAVVAAVDAGRLGWTILRPPLVHGPGVSGNFRRLLHLATLGARIPLPFGALDNPRSLVAVDNLADLMLHALRSDAAIGRAFLVSDDEDLSTTELLRRLGRALGHPVRLFGVPMGVVRGTFGLLGRGADADRLVGSFTVDGSAVRSELEWTAPLTVDAGLALVAQWWRSRGRRDA